LGWPDDTGGNFKKFWEDGFTVQTAGKDQVRFQSIMWQAMLMSAKLPVTKEVVYHGFITSGGQKMSKSLGNVIDPFSLVEEYGTDAVRYFLLRHIHPFDDSDFTVERFRDAYNADLANGLGNLVARIMKLAEDNLEKGTRPEPEGFPQAYTGALEKLEINKAADVIWERIKLLDQQITDTAPFKVIKTNPEEGRELISALTLELYGIAQMLGPFMPATAETIKQAIVENKKPDNLFVRKE